MASKVGPRIDIKQISPKTYEPVLALERYIHSVGLDPRLIELVKLRASQVNGCAYCVDMHARRLRELGEPNERVDAVTLLDRGHVSEEVFQAARKEFAESELVNLTLVVATINVWNRLAVPFRAVPESYRQGQGAAG